MSLLETKQQTASAEKKDTVLYSEGTHDWDTDGSYAGSYIQKPIVVDNFNKKRNDVFYAHLTNKPTSTKIVIIDGMNMLFGLTARLIECEDDLLDFNENRKISDYYFRKCINVMKREFPVSFQDTDVYFVFKYVGTSQRMLAIKAAFDNVYYSKYKCTYHLLDARGCSDDDTKNDADDRAAIKFGMYMAHFFPEKTVKYLSEDKSRDVFERWNESTLVVYSTRDLTDYRDVRYSKSYFDRFQEYVDMTNLLLSKMPEKADETYLNNFILNHHEIPYYNRELSGSLSIQSKKPQRHLKWFN